MSIGLGISPVRNEMSAVTGEIYFSPPFQASKGDTKKMAPPPKEVEEDSEEEMSEDEDDESSEEEEEEEVIVYNWMPFNVEGCEVAKWNFSVQVLGTWTCWLWGKQDLNCVYLNLALSSSRHQDVYHEEDNGFWTPGVSFHSTL